jgi:hypothetical protein
MILGLIQPYQDNINHNYQIMPGSLLIVDIYRQALTTLRMT